MHLNYTDNFFIFFFYDPRTQVGIYQENCSVYIYYSRHNILHKAIMNERIWNDIKMSWRIQNCIIVIRLDELLYGLLRNKSCRAYNVLQP